MAVSPAPVVVIVPVFFAMVACHRGDFTATWLIHRSAWKGYSPKFALIGFSEDAARLVDTVRRPGAVIIRASVLFRRSP